MTPVSVHELRLVLSEIEREVERVLLPLAVALAPEDTGCVVRIINPQRQNLLPGNPVRALGVQQVETRGRMIREISGEKAARLASNPGHISAYQSHGNLSDPSISRRRYPGAIRCDLVDVIISCSGFSWQLDELACLLIAWRLGWISRDRINAIIDLSDNSPASECFAAEFNRPK